MDEQDRLADHRGWTHEEPVKTGPGYAGLSATLRKRHPGPSSVLRNMVATHVWQQKTLKTKTRRLSRWWTEVRTEKLTAGRTCQTSDTEAGRLSTVYSASERLGIPGRSTVLSIRAGQGDVGMRREPKRKPKRVERHGIMCKRRRNAPRHCTRAATGWRW